MQRHRLEKKPQYNLSNNSKVRFQHKTAEAGRSRHSAFLPGDGDGHGGYASSAPLSTLTPFSQKSQPASGQPYPLAYWPHQVQPLQPHDSGQVVPLDPRLFLHPIELRPASFGDANTNVVGTGRNGLFAVQQSSPQALPSPNEQSAATQGQASDFSRHQSVLLSTNAVHPQVVAQLLQPTRWVAQGEPDPETIVKRKDDHIDKTRKDGLSDVNGACLNCKKMQKQCNSAERCNLCIKKNVECIRTCDFCRKKRTKCDAGMPCTRCGANGKQCIRPIGPTAPATPSFDPDAILQFLSSTRHGVPTKHVNIRPWLGIRETTERNDLPAHGLGNGINPPQRTAPYNDTMADVSGMMTTSPDQQTQAEPVPRSVTPQRSQSSGWADNGWADHGGAEYSPQSSRLAESALRVLRSTPIIRSLSQQTYSETTDLTYPSDVCLPSPLANDDEFTGGPWQLFTSFTKP